jgi:hypothetical protein
MIYCDHSYENVLVFFDDILIYSPTWSTHLIHLEKVLQLLLKNKFYAKLSKCNFGVTSVDYLGRICNTPQFLLLFY